MSASARYAGLQAGRLSLMGALAGAAIVVSPAPILSAASGADSLHVTASLVGATRSVVAGRPVQVALRQQIEPGWHAIRRRKPKPNRKRS